MDEITNKILQSTTYNLHKIVGICVLTLMICRVLWRLLTPKPISLSKFAWERVLEWSVHWALYIALIIMPLSGWIMSVAAGRPPQLFGWFLNLPISIDKATSLLFKSVHNTLAIVIIVLVSLHVLAAIYHYFFKKDQVWQRMSPFK